MRRLRIPCAIAFTVVAAAGVASIAPGCEHGSSPPDGQLADGVNPTDGMTCELFCIPDGTDAGVCDSCADQMGNCPVGCRPVG